MVLSLSRREGKRGEGVSLSFWPLPYTLEIMKNHKFWELPSGGGEGEQGHLIVSLVPCWVASQSPATEYGTPPGSPEAGETDARGWGPGT